MIFGNKVLFGPQANTMIFNDKKPNEFEVANKVIVSGP